MQLSRTKTGNQQRTKCRWVILFAYGWACLSEYLFITRTADFFVRANVQILITLLSMGFGFLYYIRTGRRDWRLWNQPHRIFRKFDRNGLILLLYCSLFVYCAGQMILPDFLLPVGAMLLAAAPEWLIARKLPYLLLDVGVLTPVTGGILRGLLLMTHPLVIHQMIVFCSSYGFLKFFYPASAELSESKGQENRAAKPGKVQL